MGLCQIHRPYKRKHNPLLFQQANQQTNQPTNQPIKQPPTNQLNSHQPTNQPIKQPPTNQPTN